MEALQEDTGDGSMQCMEHPFKTNTPAGGICALCLQNKLTKLVSSSFPIAVFPSSSPSSPPSRSTTTAVPPPQLPNPNPNPTSLLPSNPQITPTNPTTNCHHHQYHPNRSRILYLLGQKKNKKKDHNFIISGAGDRNKNLAFKRSKSTAGGFNYNDGDLNSPHKRGFWSFIHSQKHTNSSSSSMRTHRSISSNTMCASGNLPQIQRSGHEREIIVMEENESPNQATFDRKVSRSRSVGCGSRSFSGDFFERISTGFGDCTLRRVESNREGKSKPSAVRGGGPDCIKERVRCGGLFGGFMITSSSSSSSSSSYWVGSNPREGDVSVGNGIGKATSAVAGTERRSWGWALASPMRAFSKPLASKREGGSSKNPSPNLGAIPSLLSVRS